MTSTFLMPLSSFRRRVLAIVVTVFLLSTSLPFYNHVPDIIVLMSRIIIIVVVPSWCHASDVTHRRSLLASCYCHHPDVRPDAAVLLSSRCHLVIISPTIGPPRSWRHHSSSNTSMTYGIMDLQTNGLMVSIAGNFVRLLTLWLPNKIFGNCNLVPNKKFLKLLFGAGKNFGFSLLVPAKIWPSTFPPTTNRIFLFSEKSIGPMQKCCISFL